MNTRYRTTASLAAADVDFYRIRAPALTTPQVMTVTVRSVGPNGIVPRVEVFDGNFVRVPARVLVNGNGTYTIQATGVTKGNYFVRVFGTGTAAVGNYTLDVGFGNVAAADLVFAASSVPAPGLGANYQLFVAKTQLFGFNLTSSGPLRMSVVNAAGQSLFSLTAGAGEVVTGMSTLLPPGAYTVRFEALAGTPGVPVTFRLSGTMLTDPVGPVAGDPTLVPQYTNPTTPGTFLYPTGQITFDPYLWVFRSFL